MTTQQPLPRTALNRLQRGRTYAVTTIDGVTAAGRYLGVEVEHDLWAIILAAPGGAVSLEIDRLAEIKLVA
jgi:hypothetical protein